MPSISINPVFHSGVVIAIAVVLLVLLILGPAASRVTRKRRTLLVALRLLTIAALIFSMLRPTLVYQSTEEQAATLVVMADLSRSMGVADSGDKTRYDEMRESVTKALPRLLELGDKLRLRFYSFGTEAHEMQLANGQLTFPEQPTEAETAIGHSIAEVRRENAGERLIAMVLLSDGNQKANAPRDRAPLSEARELNATGVGLYGVAFGKSSNQAQLPDVAVEQLSAPERVFEKNNMLVTAQARLSGFVNKPLSAELLMENATGEMEVVDSRQIVSRQDGDVIPIELSYIPRIPGERKVQVRIAGQDGELVTVNNEQSTFVTVDSGGVSVLYIEGKPREEMRYLRRALSSSANIGLELLTLDAEQYIRAGTVENPRRPDDVAAKLAEAFTPGRHDVYILGNVDAKAFTAEELTRLRICVEEASAGLIMLGGPHAFSGGGYADTPLASVLPVQLDRFGKQPFDSPINERMHVLGKMEVHPAELAPNHYLTRLAGSPNENQAIWRNFPRLDGANILTPNPNATILLEGSTETPPRANIPVLVAGSFGGGRVLALAADTTWRWAFEGGFTDEHKRYWRQLVLWLARKDEGADGAVRIVLEDRRLQQGAREEYQMQAVNSDGTPIPDADWTAEIVLPDGQRQPLNLSRRGNEMVGSFAETRGAGDYVIEARATRAGAELGAAKARFLVFEQDLELERPVADFDAMQAWADASAGGDVYPADKFNELLDELAKLPRQLSKTSYLKITLFDRWPLYVIIAGLMILEWYFRKKWGLV